MTEDSGSVLAVCRVHRLHSDSGSVGVTAIDKRPVEGPVRVRVLGLHGDLQADRKHHGGEDKAVYAYSQEDADHWAALLGRDIAPGSVFGENLRTTGICASGAVIGERWQVGQRVVLEVTSPRMPCATFGRYLDEPSWVRRFTQEGRAGVYLRVVTGGDIAAGDPIAVVHRPAHGITVQQVFRGPDADMLATLARLHDAGDLVLAGYYARHFGIGPVPA